jgi:putative transposase
MARLPRVVAPGAAHHITQRGNAQRDVFESDADRRVYLELLRHSCRLHDLRLHGYCLMPNHVHLIAVPEHPDSLYLTLKAAHGRYASYLNARQQASGHVWQGRYYSCPLDRNHLWEAMRYTERNPVRAGMVTRAEEYRWSSAPAHGVAHDAIGLLDFDIWWTRFTPVSWREFLEDRYADTGVEVIRRSTHTGRPLGSAEFVEEWERVLQRPLAPKKGGRRKEVKGVEESLFQEMSL